MLTTGQLLIASANPARDILVLGLTLFGEARGEPPEGRWAVGHVIANRARIAHSGHKRALYGDGTVAGACLQKLQFSCWNENDPNSKLLREYLDAGELSAKAIKTDTLRQCILDGLHVLSGVYPDPTVGSTHYHTKGVAPAWSMGVTPVLKLGNHLFFNNIK